MGNAVEILKDDPQPAITPTQMIELAIRSNAGVETMERLLSLQARYDAMQAKKAFDNAMAELRANMPEVVKDREVSYGQGSKQTNYKFEDLHAVTKALSTAMAPLGLAFRWRTESSPSQVTVACIITHRDGHSEETALTSGVDNSGGKNAIQALGSAVTYLQRYTIKAAVGLAASSDDDGQSASVPKDKPAAPAPSTDAKSAQASARPKAQSRETYSRLSAANRACTDMLSFNRLWTHKATDVALASMPPDWKRELLRERDEKQAELQAIPEKDPFPGDLPMEGPLTERELAAASGD